MDNLNGLLTLFLGGCVLRRGQLGTMDNLNGLLTFTDHHFTVRKISVLGTMDNLNGLLTIEPFPLDAIAPQLGTMDNLNGLLTN